MNQRQLKNHGMERHEPSTGNLVPLTQMICTLSIFSRTYLFQLLLTVMCSIVVNSGCITLASMTVSLIRVSCTFGMRQQQREDHLKLHLVYIDVSQRSTGAKHLVLFSDGCPGQNKNRIIATFLLKLVHDGQFEQIDLVRGHTFLPNDRDFSVIEKRKKVEKTYLPSDWVRVVSTAKTTKPFETVHMKQEEFLDHKLVATKSSKVKFTDSTNHALTFREVVWFSYGKSSEYDTETSDCATAEEIWCHYTDSTMEEDQTFEAWSICC